MRDEMGMSLLAAETERWWWHAQFYTECEVCGLWGHNNDEFTEDPKHEVCNGCVGWFAENKEAAVRKADGENE